MLGIQFKFNLIQYLILGTTLSCFILPRIRPITLEWHKSHEKYIKWNIILIIYRQVMSWKCQPEIISFRGDRFFRILPCSLNTLMVWQRQKSKTQNLNATFTQYPEGKSELINHSVYWDASKWSVFEGSVWYPTTLLVKNSVWHKMKYNGVATFNLGLEK